MSDSILVQIQADTRAAMKAGDRDRVGTLRMITNSLQQNEKEGDGDAVAVLLRAPTMRSAAAVACASGGRPDQAEAERGEAALIETYLPEQISDEELGSVVDDAVAHSGADSVKEMGKVIGIVMGQVKGRADGKRVSTMVRERLGA